MTHSVFASAVPEAALAARPIAMTPPAAEKIEARRLPWILPERGLAVFHGHPDVPRLFHYFLPRLIAQGKAVLCLDGANRFDPLLIARLARERSLDPGEYYRSIRVARAFTCFQLTELLVRAPQMLGKFPAAALMITAVPDLYFDEDVRESAAGVSFRRALEALTALRALPVAAAVFTDATSFQTPRKHFFAQLRAQAAQVSQFAATEDGRLSLLPHPAPLRAGSR